MRGRRSLRAPLLAGDGPLARVSPVLAFVVVVAVFAVGVLVGGLVGAALLGLLVLGLVGLLGTTWRVLTPPQRTLRVLVLAVLVAVTVSVL